MSDHLQLQCWDCHQPLDEAESVKVPTHTDSPWSTSTTRVHPECARWREEQDWGTCDLVACDLDAVHVVVGEAGDIHLCAAHQDEGTR